MNTLPQCFETGPCQDAIPLLPLSRSGLDGWLEGAGKETQTWVAAQGFTATPGTHCAIPHAGGAIAQVLAGIDETQECFELGELSTSLPPGSYRLECDWHGARRARALLGFALGAYSFDRYRAAKACKVRLCLEDEDEAQALVHQIGAVYLARDLINTPANDLLPDGLQAAAATLAREFGAELTCISGDELLEQDYPAIHAVGRASACAPRLLDLRWGDPGQPRITLVGKGVCFDSGGLDLKPASGMRLMKKDMGGAAQALGLARAVMGLGLPVRLRVLVPAVENAISGNAMRPGDVVPSRKGSQIEIDNTDAEGRVILCDALHEACSEKPALLIDFATLTGAARVAVGTEIAAMFCNDDELALEVLAAGERVGDPVWRLPLHAAYRKLIESKVADISNSGSTPYAGAITAGLFLEHFVDESIPWAHFDIMAWNVSARPGRPEGGEAMALRAILEVLIARYGAWAH